MPSQTFVPAMSATMSGITVITEHIFTRKYELTTSGNLSSLATGAKAGIAIGVCAAALVLAGVVLFLLRRRRARQTTVTSRNNNMIERSFSLTFPPGPQELASPEGVGHSPGSARSDRPMSSGSPPAYNLSIPRAVSGKAQSPQELPGSTFIHEHHPAYIGSEEPSAAAYGSELASGVASTKEHDLSGRINLGVSPRCLRRLIRYNCIYCDQMYLL